MVKAQQVVGWTAEQDPVNWDWSLVEAFAARQETKRKFIEPGCQFTIVDKRQRSE